MADARKPVAAGSFYPADPGELSALVDRFLERARADSTSAKGASPSGVPKAVVTPHAGLLYSGGLAARAALALARARPDVVVLCGSAHSWPGEGAALSPHSAFSTPLGSVGVDEGLVRELSRFPGFAVSEEAHASEHSIETFLPFLQRVSPAASIVPLLVRSGRVQDCVILGKALASACKGRNVTLAISSDLSHYPSAECAERADAASMEALSSMDPDFFWKACEVLEARVPGLACAWCGRAAVTMGMTAAKELGAGRLDVLSYAHSGLVSGDRARVVGYAAACMRPGIPEPFNLSEAEGREILLTARKAMERASKRQQFVEPPLSSNPRFNIPGSAFSSLHDRTTGALRACIGTIGFDRPLLEAVAWAASRSAFADERFAPILPEEAARMRIEVSVLSPLRKVRPEDIRPGIDGVEISHSGRRALFLPQMWKSLPDLEGFLGVLCEHKAGLRPRAWKEPSAQLRAFTAQVFSED